MVNFETVKTYANKKVWGEHSLSLGEVASIILGTIFIFFWHPLGTWSKWIGLAIIVLGVMLF